MEVLVKQIKGITLAARADSQHWVVMDSDREVGGFNSASKPLELILIGLGGCTGMDVVSILKKMRVDLDDFEVVLKAERSEEHPKVFTHIQLQYRFFGKNLSKEKLEKAINLSRTKYCAVSAMLSKAVTIDYSYQINPELL